MAFNRRTITKELDMANLAKHNDNYADIKTELDAHDSHIAAQTAHGSTSAATANKIVQRDANGRAKVAAPAASDDIARKAEVDAVQTNLTDHITDADVHLSEADRDKLDGIEDGAQPNQNAFAAVNNVVAGAESDTLTIAGGTGITVTTNPTTKTVTVTATGEATPGAHGSSHDPDGSDPIPELVALRGEFDALTAADIGAETPSGAQAKVDTLAGVGNTATVAEVAEDVADLGINVRKFGAEGDGITDDHDALTDALNAGMNGGRVYFPPGEYLVGSKILLSLTGDLEIIMAKNAVIKTVEGFNDKIIQIFDDGGRHKLHWRGGTVNAHNVLFGESNDSVWVSELGEALFDGITFLFGDNYSIQKGDSGISPLNCRNLKIQNCTFIGAPDVGIYLSGDGVLGGDDYGDTIISSNHFIKCNVGIGVKRGIMRTTVCNNHFYRCSVGIQTAQATSGEIILPPGKYLLLTGNQFKLIGSRAIELVLSDYSIITNNRIEDYGKDLTDTVINLAKGIWLRGSKNCVLEGNVITFVEWADSLPTNTRPILLSEYTYNSSSYFSLLNNITANIINLGARGVVEESSNNGPNYIFLNTITNLSENRVYINHPSTQRITNAQYAQFNLDFGSVPANAQIELTQTINGVLAGDMTVMNINNSYSGGLEFFARVSSDNTIAIRARNNTASAIDPPSISFSVLVFSVK